MIKMKVCETEDIKAIVPHLRAHDAMEFENFEQEPIESLLQSLADSVEAYAVYVNSVPCVAFGIRYHSILAPAHLWFVSSTLVEKYPIAFLRHTRAKTRELAEKYDILQGYVNADYILSKNWMEWMGFSPISLADFGHTKVIKYEMRASHGH